MRNKLTYLTVMILVIGACATATQSDPTSTPELPSSGTPTASEATEPNTTSSGVDTSTASIDAIEIVKNMDVILDPGKYWIDHDADPATSLRVDFTVADPGWGSLIGATKQADQNEAENYVAVKFFVIDRVATAACDGTEYLPAGETAKAVATQLAEIKNFETLEPIAEINAFGYDGYHVILVVQQDGFDGESFVGCDDTYFDSWEGPTFSRYYQGPGQVVEFWVLDVEGALLSIEATWFPDSPAEDLAQLRTIIQSVTVTP